MKNTIDIDALLRDPRSEEAAAQLVEWAEQTRNDILCGDMMVGVLSPETVAKIPLAYEAAALSGHGAAWLKLAWWHVAPEFGEPDVVAAEQALNRAIHAGVPGAEMEKVKIIWFFKRDDASDEEKRFAYSYLSSLCKDDPNNAEAFYFLGMLTCAGFGAESSPETGFSLLKKSADLGNSHAMFELSIYCFQGIGVAQDNDGGLKMCKAAAEAGHPRAMYNLGAFYATGKHVTKDMTEAVGWYEKAVEAGNPAALVGLAGIYATGDGVKADREYAQQCLEQAEYAGIDVSMVRSALGL